MRLAELPVVTLGALRPAPAPGAPCVALAPGERVVCVAVPAPRRLRGAALARVTFHALQERLATPMAEMTHVAARGSDADGTALAVAARTEEVEAWVREAEVAGWRVAALLPDWLALPWAPGAWSLQTAEGRVRARTGRLEGFAAEAPLALAILARRLAEAAPKAALLRGDPTATAPLRAALEAAGATVADDPGALGARVLAAREDEASLTGPTERPLAALAATTRPWAVPAALAACAFAAWTGAAVLDLSRDRAAAEAHAARAEAAFRRIVGPSVPIVDMRVQTARHLDQLRARGAGPAEAPGFAPLLAAAERGLSDGRVRALGFRDGEGLTAELTVADFAALDALAARLRASGLAVEVLRAEARADEGVAAALRLTFAEGGG